jgi:hypothetical protein
MRFPQKYIPLPANDLRQFHDFFENKMTKFQFSTPYIVEGQHVPPSGDPPRQAQPATKKENHAPAAKLPPT